jgi:hypothetical protein
MTPSPLSWFKRPDPTKGPRETLRWVRRWEIASGVVAAAIGLAFWNSGPWSWFFLGIGLFTLSPWPGPGAALRRLDRKANTAVADPQRGRERARRFARLAVPIYALFGAGMGYLIGGWQAAVFIGGLMGASAAFGAWRVLRRSRSGNT